MAIVNLSDVIVLLFNVKNYLWEPRTTEIYRVTEEYYYGNFTGYRIYFKRSGSSFFYKSDRVKIYKYIKMIDIANIDILVGNKSIQVHEAKCFENGYYRIRTDTGVIESNQVTLRSNQYRKVHEYYKQLAQYTMQTIPPDDPLYHLARNYERFTLDEQSVLYAYLQGRNSTEDYEDPIIVPFDFNQSQRQAIDTALSSTISVIEGPPGTGKTQTILNLISNIVARGHNCAVISNNNSAIKNVQSKLEIQDFSFITAALGRAENVEQFFSSTNDDCLDQFLNSTTEEFNLKLVDQIDRISDRIEDVLKREIELAQLRNELHHVVVEQRNHHNGENLTLVGNNNLDSQQYLRLLHRIETPKKVRWLERIMIRWRYHVNIEESSLSQLCIELESLYYAHKIDELNKQISSLEQKVSRVDKEGLTNELKSLSHHYLSNRIAKHYRQCERKNFNMSSYKSDFASFLERYPVILSTSYSLMNNAPRHFLFDYLIIDEASQGDLLSSVLAMSCAKKMIVVGDSKQLQQIDEERLFDESRRLATQLDIPKAYHYAEHSILSSVKSAIPRVPTTLLREHYRCAPDIINFCNHMFYDSQLIPMTHNNGTHIEIVKTVPGNHARKNPMGSGMYNQREIDELKRLLESKKHSSVGVITPFRYQAQLINNTFHGTDLEADTIHKFQGREKEEVVLSFVVNDLQNDDRLVENRLYDFVTNSKLFNVAISRGQTKVTVLVSDKVYHSTNNIIHDFIHYAEHLYGNAITKTSSVSSVFDYLYAEHNALLLSRFAKHPKQHYTELLFKELLDDMIKPYSQLRYRMYVRLSSLIYDVSSLTEDELKYVSNPWTHVDFLIYNYVSKERLFVVEVDGIRYHEQNLKQVSHDSIKDKILSINKLPIYRFKTNESSEQSRLSSILHQYIH